VIEGSIQLGGGRWENIGTKMDIDRDDVDEPREKESKKELS